MRFLNYWLLMAKSRTLIKIIDWAQRHGRPVEYLSRAEIDEALKVQR